MDIAALISKVIKRDSESERLFYDYCYTHCFKIAQVYSSDISEATSTFNHAMLYVFNNLNSLSHPHKILAWVGTIVRNDCIDHIRKKSVYSNKLLKFTDDIDSNSTLNDAMTNMAMSEIMEAVNKLQPEYRLCFVMKVMDGYSYREITQQLSINENTAKWYVAEAKKTLRQLLIHYQKESDRYGS